MATVADILPEVRRTVKNCPDVTVLYAIRRAIQEFCRESYVYEQTLVLTNHLANNEEVYTLDISGNDDVLMVHQVQYNNVPLQPRRPQDSLPSTFSTGGNQPYEYIFEPPNLLYLKPIPSNIINPSTNLPYECLVKLILVPKDNQDEVPEVIYRYNKTQIGAGAAAFCLAMPGESWSNPQLSMKLENDFKYGYNEAKRRRLAGFTTGGFRVRPRGFLVQ